MQENYILCPYCISPVGEDTVFCGVCGLDTRNDAKIEMTPAQYAHALRKPCPHCQAEILSFAVLCPSCLQKPES